MNGFWPGVAFGPAGASLVAISGTKAWPSDTSGTPPTFSLLGAAMGGVDAVRMRTQRNGSTLSNFAVPLARYRRSGWRTTTKNRWYSVAWPSSLTRRSVSLISEARCPNGSSTPW